MPEFLGSRFGVTHHTVWARSLSIHSLVLNLLFLEQGAVDVSVPQFPPSWHVITVLTPVDSRADHACSLCARGCILAGPLQPSAALWSSESTDRNDLWVETCRPAEELLDPISESVEPASPQIMPSSVSKAPEQKLGPRGPAPQMESTLHERLYQSSTRGPHHLLTTISDIHVSIHTPKHACVPYVHMYVWCVHVYRHTHTPHCRTKNLSTPTLTS